MKNEIKDRRNPKINAMYWKLVRLAPAVEALTFFVAGYGESSWWARTENGHRITIYEDRVSVSLSQYETIQTDLKTFSKRLHSTYRHFDLVSQRWEPSDLEEDLAKFKRILY